MIVYVVHTTGMHTMAIFVNRNEQFTVVYNLIRYNCNVGKVCCGLMNDMIKSFVITSTDSYHVAVANLLREIIMV